MKIFNLIKSIYYRVISANKVAELEGVKFGTNCFFGTKNFGSEPYLIQIGNNFKTSANVTFITHDGAVNVLRNIETKYRDIDSFGIINIGDNVFIGFGTTILQGTSIGNNVIVGASSLVKGTLKDNSVYAGIPAKFICTIEEYALKNKNNFINTKSLNKNEKKKYIEPIFFSIGNH